MDFCTYRYSASRCVPLVVAILRSFEICNNWLKMFKKTTFGPRPVLIELEDLHRSHRAAYDLPSMNLLAVLLNVFVMLIAYVGCEGNQEHDISEALNDLAMLMKSKSDVTRLSATKQLVRLSISYPDYGATILSSEAFLYATAQLFSDSSDLRVASLHVMGVLGSVPENQQKMVDVGLVPMLVSVIDSGLEEQALAAIQTVGNLAQSAAVQEIAGNSNAVHKIAPYLKHKTDKMRRVAAGAIGNLAIHKPNADRIKEVGAVPALIALLSPSAYPGADPTTTEVAVGALRNLLVDEAAAADLVEAGIMTGLVEIMKTGNEASQETARELWDYLSLEIAELPGHDMQDGEL